MMARIKNKDEDFYNNFHHGAKIQAKVIPENNFTYRNTIKILKPLIENGNLTILDYGCGVGTVDFFLASKGHKVLGLEVSREAVQICRRSAEAIGVSSNAKFGDISKFKTVRPDLIICSEVIEHVNNDLKLLKDLADRLKKGGHILISTPTVNAPLYKLRLVENFDRRVGHLRRYDSEALIKMVRNLGLDVIRVEKVEGVLRNTLFVYPWLGWAIKFLKGPLSDIATFIDNIFVVLFGESNIYVIARKI